MRLISPAKAYRIASQYGSYIDNSDPGACMYAFFHADGRPITEEHRGNCLRWLRSLPVACTKHDERERLQLIRFLANSPLRKPIPWEAAA